MERDIGKSYAGYRAGYRRDMAGYREFTARTGSVPAALGHGMRPCLQAGPLQVVFLRRDAFLFFRSGNSFRDASGHVADRTTFVQIIR